MSLSQQFIDEINSYGADCLAGLVDALQSTQPEVSVRVNRAKDAIPPSGCTPVEWCDDGVYLESRPQFTFDPALHQGLYYVQDASSMAIAQIVRLLTENTNNQPIKYLDACAAPGGKTTAAISALPAGSIVVANEYDYRRAAVLAENLAKWGSPDVIVSRGDTARFSHLNSCFDIVAADVPCSGEGMMRKDEEAVAQWSPALVAECVGRQRELVENLWPALRPGGYFIYSTCTFNRHENEEMVDFICSELGGETVDVGLTAFDGVATAISSDHHCYRFLPGRVRGEGLFISVIRKDGDGAAVEPKPAKKPLTVFSKDPAEAKASLGWLNGEFETYMLGDRVIALPVGGSRWMRSVSSWLDVVSAGIVVATQKGRDIIPSQELALSTAFRRDAFPAVDVDYHTALMYLRRENISVNAPKGFVTLTYKGRPLGFVKNLGNRANNLYPQSWRIISQNIPDSEVAVLK